MPKILIINSVNTITDNYNEVKGFTVENLIPQVDKTKNFIEQKRQLNNLEKKVIDFQRTKQELDIIKNEY